MQEVSVLRANKLKHLIRKKNVYGVKAHWGMTTQGHYYSALHIETGTRLF